MRRLRIAMIGQKGVPASFGGVEHHVQELGSRLVARGHEVLVYTRPSYSDPSLDTYLGMQLQSIPSIATKHLDAISHSGRCSLDSRSRPIDIVHYHSIGPCLTAPLARARGRRLVATVHGQDWRRAKWGTLATLALRGAEHMALRVPDATITVSKNLAAVYEQRRIGNVHYIPNGVSICDEDDPGFVSSLGLPHGEYVVYVGRLVPEKGVHYLVEAWRRLQTDRKLVIIGDSSFTDGYVASLHHGGDNIMFPGYLYGAELASVVRHAALFVLPSDLEGLPIVLLESLALGTPALASDIPPNREVLGDQGEYFRAGDVDNLVARLQEMLRCTSELKRKAIALQPSIAERYDWDRIAEETEQLYESLLS